MQGSFAQRKFQWWTPNSRCTEGRSCRHWRDPAEQALLSAGLLARRVERSGARSRRAYAGNRHRIVVIRQRFGDCGHPISSEVAVTASGAYFGSTGDERRRPPWSRHSLTAAQRLQSSIFAVRQQQTFAPDFCSA
jgi:hypothetical protein